jgi:hypothetical protein
METVVEVVGTAFAQMGISIRPIAVGPPSWIWEDDEMTSAGLPRFFILTGATAGGIEGYPVFTIRQAYSVRFDTWITVGGVVLGPDEGQVMKSIALFLVQHAGAFAGMRYTVATVAANNSSNVAGMVAVEGLLNSPPPIIAPEVIGEIVAEVTPSTVPDGELN